MSLIWTFLFSSVFVCILFMWFRFSHYEGLNAGVVSLALAYAISLNGTFQYCVRQSAEVENLVSAIVCVIVIIYMDALHECMCA